jgi:hypothetical protein
MTNLRHIGLKLMAIKRIRMASRHFGSDHIIECNGISSSSPTFESWVR